MKTLRSICRAGCLAVALSTVVVSHARAITVGYWRFEEPEGSPALDSAGSNPGTLQVNTSRSTNVFGTPVPSTGAANTQSMFFADTSPAQSGAAVDMGTSLDRGLGDFTIEAWINRAGDNPDQYAHIAGKFPSGDFGDTVGRCTRALYPKQPHTTKWRFLVVSTGVLSASLSAPFS
jgi:hypothetical protein